MNTDSAPDNRPSDFDSGGDNAHVSQDSPGTLVPGQVGLSTEVHQETPILSNAQDHETAANRGRSTGHWRLSTPHKYVARVPLPGQQDPSLKTTHSFTVITLRLNLGHLKPQHSWITTIFLAYVLFLEPFRLGKDQAESPSWTFPLQAFDPAGQSAFAPFTQYPLGEPGPLPNPGPTLNYLNPTLVSFP